MRIGIALMAVCFGSREKGIARSPGILDVELCEGDKDFCRDCREARGTDNAVCETFLELRRVDFYVCGNLFAIIFIFYWRKCFLSCTKEVVFSE